MTWIRVRGKPDVYNMSNAAMLKPFPFLLSWYICTWYYALRMEYFSTEGMTCFLSGSFLRKKTLVFLLLNWIFTPKIRIWIKTFSRKCQIREIIQNFDIICQINSSNWRDLEFERKQTFKNFLIFCDFERFFANLYPKLVWTSCNYLPNSKLP